MVPMPSGRLSGVPALEGWSPAKATTHGSDAKWSSKRGARVRGVVALRSFTVSLRWQAAAAPYGLFDRVICSHVVLRWRTRSDSYF